MTTPTEALRLDPALVAKVASAIDKVEDVMFERGPRAMLIARAQAAILACLSQPEQPVHAAVGEIAELSHQLSEAQALVAEANNSLYGSHAYFHSKNGGAFDKYHLARPIEDLKHQARKAELATETQLSEMREALEQAEDCMSIVEPRSDKAEYLRILGVVRAALSRLEAGSRR